MDPRQEKLQRMVDQGRIEFEAAIGQIQREYARRSDLMVKPSKVQVTVDDTDVPKVDLYGGDRLNFTPYSYQQFLGMAGVPKTFADRLMTVEERPLLQDVFNRMTAKMMLDGVLVRRVDDTIKGWLSPSYKRMDSAPIIEAFIKGAVDRGMVPFKGRNTDYRNQIQFVVPEVVQASENEYNVFGLSLVTGDYGSQAIEMNMLLVRLACTNLCEGYDLFRKIHLGSRFNMGGQEQIQLSTKTLELDGRTVASAIVDATAQFGDHVEILKTKVAEAARREISDPTPLYANLRDRGLKKSVVDQVKALYEGSIGIEVLPQENSQWRFANALSYVAKGLKSQDEQIDAERVAMQLIN